ncbi:MAG: recombination protein RecR [Candidatus Campbellbacteria bacterium]
MHSIQKLAEYFQKFPGIGPRQAKRFVHFLLTQEKSVLEDLSKRISELRGSVAQCPTCFRFYDADGYADVCDICSSPNRDAHQLMLVEKDADLDAIEKSHAYTGRYFVLGGTVPLLQTEKNPLRTGKLKKLLDNNAEITEIIIATGAHPEGEMTAEAVRAFLAPLSQKRGLTVSELGRGLSTGTELEYSDAETIKSALENRR